MSSFIPRSSLNLYPHCLYGSLREWERQTPAGQTARNFYTRELVFFNIGHRNGINIPLQSQEQLRRRP